MTSLRLLARRLRSFFRRNQIEKEMAEEMRFHLEMRTKDQIADGLRPEEAPYAAQRKFGNVGLIQGRCRDRRGFMWLEQLLQDVRYAMRQLAKSPGFTLVSIVILALGIAMSTSTFSMTNSLLLRAMPFPDSDRLVKIFRTSPESQMGAHSPGNFLDIREDATSFSSVAAYYPLSINLAEPGQPPELVWGSTATASFLTTLGIQPSLGRGFSADQDKPGKGDVIILTNSYWIKRFAGDPKIIGRTLRLGTNNVTVIGVLPASFDSTWLWFGSAFVSPETIWPNFPTLRSSKWYQIIGRLKPGVSLRAVQTELAAIGARLAKDHPADNAVDNLRATELASSSVDGGTRKLYWLVTGLAVSVLVIACANLASVQIARAFSRSHEFAVRSALGASRLALMEPLLVESSLLSIAGGITGVLMAYWANHLISRNYYGRFEIPLDGRVTLFAALAALMTALTFGLAPAWLTSSVSTGDALKESSRGSASGRLQRLKYTLIVVQLACALVLVSAALSFGIAVRQHFERDLGWRRTGLMSGVVSSPGRKFELVRKLHDELERIPGVAKVTISSKAPTYGYSGEEHFIVDGAAPIAPGKEPLALSIGVDSNFLPLLSIPLRSGRNFPDNVKASDPPVVIINETMARQYWPDQDPVGKRLHFVDKEGWCEVIGIVGDVSMTAGFGNPLSRLRIYRALEQEPVSNGTYSFILKSTLPPDSLLKPVRKAAADIDPDITLEDVGGVDQWLKSMVSGSDLILITLGSFAFIGLMIALIGIYGVITQLTVQRQREIGVRMALGADYNAVVRMILLQSGRLLLGGALIGLAGAYGVSRIYEQTMPGLQVPGAGLQAGIATLLVTVGLAACHLPARRAGGIDPVVAMRVE